MNIPSSITEQIDSVKSLEISYRVLHPSAVIQDNDTKRNIEIPFSSLTNKYHDFLDNIIITIELDDVMMSKYRYKPKLVSEELYGITELWSDILSINNCVRVSDFKPKYLKVYDPDKLKAFINEILVLEKIIN